jgi:hypothetical protein
VLWIQKDPETVENYRKKRQTIQADK